MPTGRIVILSGPSGVGKDTVIDAWAKVDPRVVRVVAYATRNRREKEVDGVDYNFVTVEKFRLLAAVGAFLEYKQVFKNYYATPKRQTDQLLAEGKVAVLKIDVQGALDVMKLRPEAISVFLLPTSLEELEIRLETATTGKRDNVKLRLQQAKNEIALSANYQHRIVNDKVADVVTKLMELTAA